MGEISKATDEWWTGTHIDFVKAGDTGKTEMWDIQTNDGEATKLGTIKWYAPWRRYVLIPRPDTIFEFDECLPEILQFGKMLMEQYKLEKKGEG